MRAAIVFAIAVFTSTAHAEDARPRCALASRLHSRVDALSGEWKELSPAQWQFMRGVYVMSPLTLPGLPMGDKVVLATTPGSGAVLFFIDGDQACTPIPAPDELLLLLHDVGEGKIPHDEDKK
jgi:hypothetical protein